MVWVLFAADVRFVRDFSHFFMVMVLESVDGALQLFGALEGRVLFARLIHRVQQGDCIMEINKVTGCTIRPFGRVVASEISRKQTEELKKGCYHSVTSGSVSNDIPDASDPGFLP
ncbi:hypothetical protein LF63_0112585 [Oleiagrimonas soli]|nr:hypothetical protein LF63_0112585 [Oleiagrimonas soli]